LDRLAASDPYPDYGVSMVRTVLPPPITTAAYTLPPGSIETNPTPDYAWLGVRAWNVSKVFVNESWRVSFQIQCSVVGTWTLFPAGSRVTYVDYAGNVASVPFAPQAITCVQPPPRAAPTNVTTTWDGGVTVGIEWEAPTTPFDHLRVYRSSDPRGFANLSPAGAYAWVAGGLTAWTDPEPLSSPGERYYVVRSANNGETSLSLTSNTAGVFAGRLNGGLTAISRPLEYFPWVDYSGAELDTLGEYVAAFGAQDIAYLSGGAWVSVPGAGDPNRRLALGEAFVVNGTAPGLFVFTGLPGAMLQFHDEGSAGFDPATNARNLTASLVGGDILLRFPRPAGMAGGSYEVWFSPTRTGFFDGTASLVGGAAISDPGTPTVIVAHIGALSLGDEIYYLVVPVNAAQERGASTYSLGVWARDFSGHDTLALPLRPNIARAVSWYVVMVPRVSGVLWLSAGGAWVPHATAMPSGVYDALVVLGGGYQITVAGTVRYYFVGG
ncbi:MAG TPA: hypothetical protein VJ397_08375, partial [Thermoplasmata archaeon]|nr:hypothetical protein [Thermoplasmata archaeon]